MPSIFDDLFSGGRGLIFSVHGRAATYYVAATGGSTTYSITIIGFEQLGATDDVQIFNAALRASEVAAPAEGDWFVFSGETTRQYIVNIKSQPNGDFLLRGRSRLERT